MKFLWLKKFYGFIDKKRMGYRQVGRDRQIDRQIDIQRDREIERKGWATEGTQIDIQID